MAGSETGGLWSILILMLVILAALFIFFEVLGYSPAGAPAGGAAAK